MNKWHARRIRTGIRMANMCWDRTKYGGWDNEYYLRSIYTTRISLGRLSRRAFDARLEHLRGTGKVVQP